MAPHLFFPAPGSTSSSLPVLPSLPLHKSTQEIDPTARRLPPNYDFSPARRAARILRQPKTPFIPSKRGGKEKDLSGLSISELEEMLLRNRKLLATPSISASLPFGNKLIKQFELKLINQLNLLNSTLKLRNLHLQSSTTTTTTLDTQLDRLQLSTPPTTKAKIISSIKTTSPNHLTTSLSYAESFQLQRKAVERERIATAKRNAQLLLEAQRATLTTGDLLKNALASKPNMANFMFHNDSEEEDFEEEETFAEEEQKGEEDNGESELNPYREAFIAGYNEAENEIS